MTDWSDKRKQEMTQSDKVSTGRFPDRSPIASFRYEHLAAGITGGVVATLALHPLDLLKIRFAVDDGKSPGRPHYLSLRHALRSIVQEEGFTGLYKGITPNLTGSGTAWGLYFLFYDAMKSKMQGGNSKMKLSPGLHLLAAGQSGVLTLALTNPIWVVKTRLVLQYDLAKAPRDTTKTHYKGMIDALYQIHKTEGFRGLYRGFVPGLWGISHGAVQFMIYEELKSRYNDIKDQPIDTKLTTMEYLTFAALSKLVAVVLTFPYQVVRARLQDHESPYEGSIHCLKQTYRNEGVSGLYKGLLPNLLRVVPATAITFVVYEKVSAFLGAARRGTGDKI